MTWTRYVTPALMCVCSCSLTAHNTDTKRQACSVCSCSGFVLHAKDWTEHRVVREVVR